MLLMILWWHWIWQSNEQNNYEDSVYLGDVGLDEEDGARLGDSGGGDTSICFYNALPIDAKAPGWIGDSGFDTLPSIQTSALTWWSIASKPLMDVCYILRGFYLLCEFFHVSRRFL